MNKNMIGNNMQANVNNDVSKLYGPKNQLHESRGIVIDLSYKLFLIGWVRKNNQVAYRLGGAAISEAILLEHTIYIEAQECDKLLRDYSFLLNAGNRYSLILSFATVLVLIITSGSLLSCVLALFLFPLIVNFYTEINTFIRLFSFNPKKLIPSLVTTAESLGSTAIVIASRNEPFEVAKMTFDSALSLIYPSGKKEIIVVDNSDITFPDYEKWRNYVGSFEARGPSYLDGVRVVFIHREGTVGFKPRNLDIALDAVTSEFILYLDIDSTVLEDTLLRITPLFLRDKNIGFVQLHTIPTNAKGKSSLSLVQCLRNYFLRLETGFYTHTSHSLFYGHNAIWRTDVVREIGSCLEYHNDEVVVTEDLSMSLRASFKGYYGVGAWLHSGEWVPESMKETEAMWLRWTVGTYQVYAKHFTKIENLKKLSRQEIMGWLQHIGVLINYGLLPVYVACGLIFNSKLLMSIAAISLLPEIIQGASVYFKLSLGGMNAFKKGVKCYSSFLILGAFINWIRCIGLLRYITGRKQGWTPTGKSSEGEISFFRIVVERGGLLSFGAACFFYALYSFAYIVEGYVGSGLVIVCALYGLNSILAVLMFGKSGMQESTEVAVTQGHINHFKDFYIKSN